MPSATRSFSDISVLEYWKRFESDSQEALDALERDLLVLLVS
jgi:hypothetical protein